MRIVICGATSHIASAIIPFFSEHDLTLFARNTEKLKGLDARIESDFSQLSRTPCDILINCIGAGTPNIVRNDPSLWFSVLEEFDNLALESIKRCSPEARYIHFSSGAVFDRDSGYPSTENSSRVIYPNNIQVKDYYSVSKIYAEAKHRSMSSLRILDLRIFSFFSRHIKLDSGYFMTDMVSAIKNDTTFVTSPHDIARDFPAPEDLAQIILRSSESDINTAADVRSAEMVRKSQIISHFTEKFGLKVEYTPDICCSPNGNADVYYSASDKLQNIIDYTPRYTSIETLLSETAAILQNSGQA
ncbi:MAG: NAD(P)-dependent oxidoreductase [Lentisphaerae bacterium]|nr:NAD(P)-dependent oxidoreductase [Lentisphaerota bacterium]